MNLQRLGAARIDHAPLGGDVRRMQTMLLRLARQFPPTRSYATPSRIFLLVQFMKFGTVGTVGWMADTATVYSLRHSLGLYGAGAAAYLVGASTTWLFNRIWTFRGLGAGSVHRQWVRFLMVNLVGFTLNRGTYAILVTYVPLCAREPVFATAARAIAGMFMNSGL